MLYSTDKEEEKRLQEYYDNPNAERKGRGISWATHMAMMHHQFNVDKSIKEARPNPFGLPDLITPDDWEPTCHEGNHGKFEGI